MARLDTLSVPSSVLSSACLAAAVAALLRAELTSSRRWIWLTKPLASTLFVVTALLAGALGSSFGQLILLGLLLSWFGDVLLIPKRQLFFVAGLGSFLLAHLAFSGAFVLLPQDKSALALAVIAMAIFALIVLRWLWPNVPVKLRPAVASYLGAISMMVVLAAGTTAATGPQLLIGAVLFAVSDIFVARDRFVSHAVINRLCGLPLYYSAQLILALNAQ